MAFPFMAAALALSEMIPCIKRWLINTENDENATQRVAEKVVVIAKKLTQCDDVADAVKHLQNDAQTLIEFQKEIIKLDDEMERSFLNDRQNARARDIALATAGRQNIRADIMVIAAASGLCLCLGSLVAYQNHLPGEAVGIISTVAGIFGACLKDAYAFEFGSSRGSKNKDLAVLMHSRSL